MDERIKKDAETCLFAYWTRGEHRDDMVQFQPEDFIKQDLFKAIRDNTDVFKICQAVGWDLVQLYQLANLFVDTETFYEQSLVILSNARVARMMKNAEKMSGDDIFIAVDYANSVRATFEESKTNQSAVDEFFDGMTERRSERAARWNIPSLDNWTGGIHRKELTIIAARPGCGKSSFALQVANSVRKNGQRVLFFPLEMSRNQMIERLLIGEGMERAESMSRGIIENEEETANFINELSQDMTFYEGEANLSQIEKRIKEQAPYLVVIDQLSQTRAPEQRFGTDREQLAYMTNNLKAIALRENVAILLLHQLNRPAEGGFGTMANLKGSGSCEEDADNVILLAPFSRNQWEDLEPIPFFVDFRNGSVPVRVELSKHRNGRTDKLLMEFNKPRFRFYERETKYDYQ